MNINTLKISVGVEARGSKLIGSLRTASDPLSLAYTNSMANGEGSGLVSKSFAESRTLAGSASYEYDLRGVLFDAFGDAADFTRIKVIAIRNTSADNSITVGGASANAWTGPFASTENIGPLGTYLNCRGDATAWPVTAGTADKLKILNLGVTSTTFEITLVGCIT